MIKWGMFTTEGEQRVQQIVERAVDLAGSCTDDELWKWCYASLEVLSREKGFGEATDTVVREAVFGWLVDHNMIDSKKIDYWFYVGWMVNDGDVTPFVKYLEQWNA